MRTHSLAVIVCLAATSCTADHPGDRANEQQGIAELRVDAASLQAANVTRVTVEVAGGIQDLVFNPASGTFDAALFLASGSQTVIGRAFSDDVLVGASNPVTVDVTPGNVTRAVLRILDLTVATPVFGPLFDSLTFPTTVNAKTTATFALAVVAPAHDPVTYLWSSDCADSTFTAPGAAQTGWFKPSQGSCQITVVATSNGFSITQSFLIVVFPEGSNGGAVDISGAFITRPETQTSLTSHTQGCLGFQLRGANALDSSCPIIVSAPDTLRLDMKTLGWGSSTPGDFDLADDCGGRFGIDDQNSDSLLATWMPPAAGGLCILTARAINGDGIATSQSFAFLTRPGTLPVTRPPLVGVGLSTCSLSSPQDAPQDCGEFAVNSRLGAAVGISWQDSRSGIVTVTDDCGGGQFRSTSSAPFGRIWITSGAPGTTCHLTATATNLEGVTTTVAATYRLR